MTAAQRILVIALCALAIMIGLGVTYLVQSKQNADGSQRLIAVTPDAFGGPFSLTDHNGKRVTEKDYTGKYRLIYFGFTYCPAICPTELSKITSAINLLGEQGKEILPMFVTVDPERDTAEKMKSYVSMFHPAMVGLTGTSDEIAATLKGYKVYAKKVQDESLSEYTMDHSSFIYLIGPDDRLLHIFKISDTAQQMAQTTKAWLDQNASAP